MPTCQVNAYVAISHQLPALVKQLRIQNQIALLKIRQDAGILSADEANQECRKLEPLLED